jgi:ABC-type molybdate transport system permease subunit
MYTCAAAGDMLWMPLVLLPKVVGVLLLLLLLN